MQSCIMVIDVVQLTGINHHVKGYVGGLESVDQLHAIRYVNIVIRSAMYQQESSLQGFGMSYC